MNALPDPGPSTHLFLGPGPGTPSGQAAQDVDMGSTVSDAAVGSLDLFCTHGMLTVGAGGLLTAGAAASPPSLGSHTDSLGAARTWTACMGAWVQQ